SVLLGYRPPIDGAAVPGSVEVQYLAGPVFAPTLTARASLGEAWHACIDLTENWVPDERGRVVYVPLGAPDDRGVGFSGLGILVLGDEGGVRVGGRYLSTFVPVSSAWTPGGLQFPAPQMYVTAIPDRVVAVGVESLEVIDVTD